MNIFLIQFDVIIALNLIKKSILFYYYFIDSI